MLFSKSDKRGWSNTRMTSLFSTGHSDRWFQYPEIAEPAEAAIERTELHGMVTL